MGLILFMQSVYMPHKDFLIILILHDKSFFTNFAKK